MDSTEVKTSFRSRAHSSENFHSRGIPHGQTDRHAVWGNHGGMLAISPDGNHLVYVCTFENELYLCLRNLGDDTFKLLKESKTGLLPFFSPDSKWVGFVTADKIKKIELSSGFVKKIYVMRTIRLNGATWGSDGMIYFGDSEGASFF